jgi:energy-coupling factor transporter ATP-binding protein EcfA2
MADDANMNDPGVANQAQEELKTAIQEMCSVREPLEVLFSNFSELNRTYLSSIERAAKSAGIEERELNYRMELLGKEARDRIMQAIANPRPVVAFAGANSSGKSSLVNVLLGVELLPAGEGMVTGNACRLRYAPRENAKISFYRLNEATFSLIPDATKPEIPLNDVEIEDLPDVLSIVLLRPDAPFDTQHWSEKAKSYLDYRRLVPAYPAASSIGADAEPSDDPATKQWIDWATTIVDVQYDLELLKPGFELIDLPGTTIMDKPEFQNFLKQFLRVVRPIPVFVFQNPSIADAERSCLELMQECMAGGGGGGPGVAGVMGSPIFLASNYFDLSMIRQNALPAGRRNVALTEAHAATVAANRYDMIRNNSLVQAIFGGQMPDTVDTCAAVGFMSCLDVQQREQQSEASQRLINSIFGKFVPRFHAFIASAYRQQLMQATSLLLSATEVFLSVVNAKPGEMQSFYEEARSAQRVVAEVQTEVKEVLESDLLLAAYGTIMARANNPERITRAKQLAVITSIPEDKKSLFHEDEAAKSLLDAMKPWIVDNIYLPALKELNSKVAALLCTTLKRKITQLPRPNRMLDAAIAAVFDWEFLKHNEIETRSRDSKLEPWMIATMIAAAPVSIPLGLALGLVSLPFLLVGIPIYLAVKKIDADWKMKQAESLLLAIGSSSNTIDTDACGQIVLKKIEEEVERRVLLHQLVNKLQGALHTPFNTVLMPQFTALGAKLLRLRTILLHGLKNLPVVDTAPANVIGSGASCKVYGCVWKKEPHVFKLPNNGMDISQEILYSYILSPSASKGFTELKGVMLLNGRLGMILPRYQSDLRSWLIDNVNTMTPIKSAKVLLPIAVAMDALHQLGFIHRDIKLENVLVRTKANDPGVLEVAVADFGITISSEVGKTPIGTACYMAPEMKRSGYGKEVDIWAFGVLMWEILPKPLMVRPPRRLKRPLPLPLTTPKQLLALYEGCMQLDPSKRCPFRQIVEVLNEFIATYPDMPATTSLDSLAVSEQLCFVCMEKPPNQRLKPCNHTGLCGDCAQVLIVLGKNCPLCRAPIDDVKETVTGL